MTVRRWKKSDPREREGQRGKFPDAGAADVLPDPVLGHVVRECLSLPESQHWFTPTPEIEHLREQSAVSYS